MTVVDLTHAGGESAPRATGLLRASLGLWRTRVGLAVVAAVALVAWIGPYVAPHASGAFVAPPNSGPTAGALFGSDYLGQDVWSRFLLGGRSILTLSLAATALGVGLGLCVGLIAAYARNVLDDILMRTMDVFMAIPQLILALVAVSILGSDAWLIVLVVGLSTAPRVSRVIRGAAAPVVEMDFVAAGEALGDPRGRIIAKDVLPNVTGPLIVEATLRLTYAIGLIASLAFLGFTADPNAPDWGLMLQENRLALLVQPWGVVLPAAAIALLTVGTGLVGDGLARALAGLDREVVTG
ncbi:MAG: ABC transporter permease [Gaiellales bacterium]